MFIRRGRQSPGDTPTSPEGTPPPTPRASPGDRPGAPGGSVGEDPVVVHLASLNELAYFRVQKASAEKLGITPANLDRLVKAHRKQLSSHSPGESGSDVLFEDKAPWLHPVAGAGLLDDLATTIRRYVICEDSTTDTAALWIAFTWLIDAFDVAPIANITAPMPNCGKSTLLDLFEIWAYRPLKADNISPAALFRSVEKWRPTLLIDEVDAFLRDDEDARGILNSGHKRNGFVLRVVGENHEPRRFSTWGAKALCGIGKIAPTLHSRSIKLELRRKLPGEKVENLRHADPAHMENLTRRLARFASDNRQAAKAARPEPLPWLNNRAQDNWEPLLAIAALAGGTWPAKARQASMAICGQDAANSTPDTKTELLADIRDAFARQKADKIFSADMLDLLCADEEAPWAAFNKGRPLSQRQLAGLLSSFGIKPDDVRVGISVRKGYALEKFRDAFRRYL